MYSTKTYQNTLIGYYAFGAPMPEERNYPEIGYRYGFNGKENDDEVKGPGNQQDYGFRIYDPRLGRFLSVDPLTKSYPFMTPYAFAENSPIGFIDLDGLERNKRPAHVNNAKLTVTSANDVLGIPTMVPEEHAKFKVYQEMEKVQSKSSKDFFSPQDDKIVDASMGFGGSSKHGGVSTNTNNEQEIQIKGINFPANKPGETKTGFSSPLFGANIERKTLTMMVPLNVNDANGNPTTVNVPVNFTVEKAELNFGPFTFENRNVKLQSGQTIVNETRKGVEIGVSKDFKMMSVGAKASVKTPYKAE